MTVPTIPKFFEGKCIFITGATGFMGKVLLEKLLRSCNDLKTVYILVRGKRGKTAKERWQDVMQIPCFDRLKEEYPLALSQKVTVIEGDVREPKFGLSDEDYNILIENVNVVFHVAASVRFNDPISEAIKMNTVGTKNVMDFAVEIKQLLVVLHVSTAYCYCQQTREVEEKLYSCNVDWRTAIEIAEHVDPSSLDILCDKFTDSAPNTYVFTKALAEQIVDGYKDKVPIVIFRPSIVISSWKEPMPGWIDNFNGPIGLIIAGGKGVLRMSLSKHDAVPDYMAVDISIKAMIIAAWKMGVANTSRLGTMDIYNSSTTSTKSISNKALLDMCGVVVEQQPLGGGIWSPSLAATGSRVAYRINAFFLHFLIAVVVDSVLRVLGKNPMLLRIQIKIHNAMMALGYFTTKEWKIKNSNFRALCTVIPEEDKENFDFNFDDLDVMEFFVAATIGGKKYLLHEDSSQLSEIKARSKRLKMINYVVKGIFALTIGYILYSYLLKFL